MFSFLHVPVIVAADKQQTIKIGVLAFRGVDYALESWNATADYLSKAVPGYRFSILPLDLSEFSEAIENQEIQFVITNTGHYVELEEKFGITRIATLRRKILDSAYTRFGAVVLVRSDRTDLQSLHDLKGKSFMGVKEKGFGGFRMAWHTLLQNGIDPYRDFSELRFSGFPQSSVVYAVRDGVIDAGTVRTNTLEWMQERGNIDIDQFRILNPRSSDQFPLLHSTKLYPEWPFARVRGTHTMLSEQVTIALFELTPRHQAAIDAGIAGWTVPMDYQPVHDLYKDLRVGPYADLGKISLEDVFHQYWPYILAVLSGLIVLILVVSIVLNLERKVRRNELSLLKAQRIAHMGNWEWDIEQNKLCWSEQLYHLLEVDLHSEEISFQFFMKMIHPADHERVLQAVNNSIYRKKLFSIDHRILLKDGAERIVHQQAELIVNKSGKVVRMLGIVQDITERKLAEERVRESESNLKSILINMQDTFFRIESDRRIVFVSPSIEQLTGYKDIELLERPVDGLLWRSRTWVELVRLLKKGNDSVIHFEAPVRHKSGTKIIVSINAHVYCDEDGEPIGVEGVARDITDLKKAQDALYREKERIQVTLESIGDCVISTNVEGVVQYMNPSAENLTTLKTKDVQGVPLLDVFNVQEPSHRKELSDWLERLHNNQSVMPCSYHDAGICAGDGKDYVVEYTMAPICDNKQRVSGAVLVFHDVTEIREVNRRIAYQAKHDPLTGLVNRAEFERNLNEALLEMTDEDNQNALFFMDLDQFKIVNDSCGHIAGDELLKQLTNRLKSHIRDSDVFGRLGGDEFGLLLKGCQLEKAQKIANSLLRQVREFRFVWEEQVFDVGVSIGLVPIRGAGLSMTQLLGAADSACYIAKERGRNRVHVYKDDDKPLAFRKSKTSWVGRIRAAMANDQFSLYCQNIVPLKDEYQQPINQILLRMSGEDGELIPPMAFIPAIERQRMMPEVDRWVIDHALDAMEQNRNINTTVGTLYCFDISCQSVNDAEFIRNVLNRLNSSRIPNESIGFEIKEAVALSNFEKTRQFMQAMGELGCRFVLGDFGIALSSFSYLKNLPVEFLKIDSNLIQNIADNPVDYAMVHSINQVAHVMGKYTIAEIVDAPGIMDRLRGVDLDFVQSMTLHEPWKLSGEGPDRMVDEYCRASGKVLAHNSI